MGSNKVSTGAIQKAIDACVKNGGGSVRVLLKNGDGARVGLEVSVEKVGVKGFEEVK